MMKLQANFSKKPDKILQLRERVPFWNCDLIDRSDPSLTSDFKIYHFIVVSKKYLLCNPLGCGDTVVNYSVADIFDTPHFFCLQR